MSYQYKIIFFFLMDRSTVFEKEGCVCTCLSCLSEGKVKSQRACARLKSYLQSQLWIWVCLFIPSALHFVQVNNNKSNMFIMLNNIFM